MLWAHSAGPSSSEYWVKIRQKVCSYFNSTVSWFPLDSTVLSFRLSFNAGNKMQMWVTSVSVSFHGLMTVFRLTQVHVNLEKWKCIVVQKKGTFTSRSWNFDILNKTNTVRPSPAMGNFSLHNIHHTYLGCTLPSPNVSWNRLQRPSRARSGTKMEMSLKALILKKRSNTVICCVSLA